jgi:dephospho-CoA kinase
MKVIGITGGIGAGKSVVTGYLHSKGYDIIDADDTAREAAAPGSPALESLARAFGDDILNADGTLDRGRLAALAFADEDKTRQLNEILHDDIGRRIRASLDELKKTATEDGDAHKTVFLSVPLMFESGLDSLCDEVWLVSAPEEVRIKRAMQRDGMTEQQVQARAARQMSEQARRTRADKIIENTKNKSTLTKKIETLLKELSC